MPLTKPALSLGTAGEATREPHGLPAVKTIPRLYRTRRCTGEMISGPPLSGQPGKAVGHAVGKLTLRHDLAAPRPGPAVCWSGGSRTRRVTSSGIRLRRLRPRGRARDAGAPGGHTAGGGGGGGGGPAGSTSLPPPPPPGPLRPRRPPPGRVSRPPRGRRPRRALTPS